MDFHEEIRSLSRISERFRKTKKPKSKWPAEFQLRVLRLIEVGFSPSALSKKLGIPGQTYYHWRRVWKHSSKKGLNFIELSAKNHDKLESSQPTKKRKNHCGGNPQPGAATIALPYGVMTEHISTEIIFRILQDTHSA